MKNRKNYRRVNCILMVSLVTALLAATLQPLTVYATTVNGLQSQINTHKNELQTIYNQISAMESEQDILQEEIDDLNAEILNIMTSIGLKADEITAKEAEIAAKQAEIAETEKEYEAVKAKEETQRTEMLISTRLMYERGAGSYIGALLAATGLADILNRLDFVEKVYVYERDRLLEYMELKEQVQELWDKLERDKLQLESDKLTLEADRSNLETQRAALDEMLAVKKEESANFEAEIAKAQEQAKKAKDVIQKEEAQLKQLQALAAAQNAANATYATTAYSAVIDAAEGSELGKQIARYACQYIGNPYVWGGTSLTNGADCSGFTYRIYANFGYKISRSSIVQQSEGVEVTYDEIQPGDIICYEGHVAMYIGGDLIVHASNSKPYPKGGIKVSNARYREILTIRRIIK